MANTGTEFEAMLDRFEDWVGERDSRALARIVAKRATGPAIGEPADMPRWLARLIIAASAAVMLTCAIAAGATGAALTRAAGRVISDNHIHMVAGNDRYFQGVMIGNPDRAIIIGHVRSGFIVGTGKLD